MALEITAGPGTEAVRRGVEDAVREGLGERSQAGDWRLSMDRVHGGYLVDLTNGDGFVRQWLFRADEPIEYEIRQALRSAP